MQELSQVFFELWMTHKLWFAEQLAGFGLSPIQARTLLCVDPDHSSTMSEVAQQLGCGPSNITGLIDKLETRGLVARRPSESDRRIRTVAITRKGEALRGRLATRLAEPAPWMHSLTADDQRRLIEILRRAIGAPGPVRRTRRR